jgi:hypothetical protein
LRRLSLLVAAGALMGGTLTACVGIKPPPPVDPHDVLVVGDSVSFSFGCVLGDAIPGIDPSGCPPRNGYTTHNEAHGGCTISPGTILLYNSATVGVPNCDFVPDAQGRTWSQAADTFTPKVVVINTAGFEIVDRWLNYVAVPDYQWGGDTSGQYYVNAAVDYSNALYQTIKMFRDKPWHPTVVVANAPYVAPTEPEPNPNIAPPGLGCTWWEPYTASPPVSTGPDCTGDATGPGSGGSWRPPWNGVTYRSSHVKYDQFNVILNQVLTTTDPNFGFGSDPGVVQFNFKKHFNDGPNNQYSDYVCPPPNDSTEAPDSNNMCSNGTVPAILARDADHSHLSSAGEFDVLQPYIESCVESLLGIGGSLASCS